MPCAVCVPSCSMRCAASVYGQVSISVRVHSGTVVRLLDRDWLLERHADGGCWRRPRFLEHVAVDDLPSVQLPPTFVAARVFRVAEELQRSSCGDRERLVVLGYQMHCRLQYVAPHRRPRANESPPKRYPILLRAIGREAALVEREQSGLQNAVTSSEGAHVRRKRTQQAGYRIERVADGLLRPPLKGRGEAIHHQRPRADSR